MRSLRFKLIAMLIGLMILGMVPIFYDTYNNIQSALMKEKRDTLLQSTTSEALNIGDRLDSAKGVVVRTSNDEVLKDGSDSKKINEELTNHVIKDFIINMNITDVKGVVAYSSDPNQIGKSYGDQPFIETALANEASVADFVDFQNKKVHFYAFSPIQNTAGTITGITFAELEETTLFNTLTSTTLHDIGDLVVVNKDGIVMHSTVDEDQFKSLWDLSDSEKKDIQTKYNDKNADPKSMQYNEVKDKIENLSNPLVFDFFCKEDKEDELMSIAQTGSYPIYLTTEFEKEKIQDILIKNIILRILIACFVVGVIVCIFGILSINHLLKPLKALKRAVESIGRGNLDQKINIKTHDEFRELGDAIETMASDLRKADIVKEVKSETTPPEQNPSQKPTTEPDASLDQVDDSSKKEDTNNS